MPSIAGQSPWDALRFNLRTLVLAAVPPLGAPASVGGAEATRDALAARAIAAAGLAALVGLPFLMLSSLVLGAPLAVPAAIASGYLAISHALASSQPQRAALISGIVLAALVGWLVLYLFSGAAPLSRSGLAAALMTPLFAAAPALARSFLAPRGIAAAGTAPRSRAAARERVACLDELAPSEAVLIADDEGIVLAATRAARERLRLLPDAFEHPLASLFDPSAMPEVVDAVRRCKAHGAPAELMLEGDAAAWTVAPCDGGMVSLRLASATPAEPHVAPPLPALEAKRLLAASADATAATGGVCDIGEAVVFGLKRMRPQAEANGIALTSEIAPCLRAACHRQIGRRIAHLLIEHAEGAAAGGGAIRVDARRLKGIVLLRIAFDSEKEEAAPGDPPKLAALRALVEEAGGTLVVDRNSGRQVLSVRLDLADVASTKGRTEERVEAG